MFDVLVVGGGPAGLSAALILGRCRRRVLVCDSGRPRNAVTGALHGFLSRDGIAPEEFRRIGREQLAVYDTVEVRQATVVDAARIRGTFSAELDDGCTVHARKLLIATGVVDVLPSVPGLRSLYGSVVFHCAYCDGWEMRDRPLAIYGRGESAVSEVRALTRFSRDIILCTDDDEALPATVMASIERTGAMVCSARVRRLESCPAGLVVVFADGSMLQRGALFFCGPIRMQSPLAQRLGCAFAPNGLVETLENEAAGVPGVYVAGDASRSVLLSVVAAGEGATAAFAINRELLQEDLGA